MKRDSLIYQILPASFNQDIAGITRKLDYLADLGVTTIWLNPFYPSGGKDNGYDPTDMRAVASNFGTMQDFDRLIEEAGKSNIGVIVDLIAGHVSDQHVWFQEARSNRDNPKRDYFVWRDVRQRNNWLSMFGGSEPMPAWTYDEKTRQDYLHHFFPQQPTLNLRHPEVVEDILNTVKFWKSRGVAGFRVDAVDHLFHDIQFRDNPRITDDLSVKPFKRQLHLHDIMQIDETLGFLARIRAAADSSLLLIAEVSSQQAPLSTAQRISLYTSEGGFDSAYTLGLIREPELNPSMFSKMYKETVVDAAAGVSGGRICWATQCHDEKRREHSAASAEFYLYLSLVMPGDKCIYYGEERGQKNDVTLLDSDPYKRGPSRGKILWGEELQEHIHNHRSHLNRYKRAIAFWNENRDFLSNSKCEFVSHGDFLCITRYDQKRSIQFLFNAFDRPVIMPMQDLPVFYDDEIAIIAGNGTPCCNASNLILPPHSIVKLDGPPLPVVPHVNRVHGDENLFCI